MDLVVPPCRDNGSRSFANPRPAGGPRRLRRVRAQGARPRRGAERGLPPGRAEALGTDFAKVIERQDDGRTLFVRAGIGLEARRRRRARAHRSRRTAARHSPWSRPCRWSRRISRPSERFAVAALRGRPRRQGPGERADPAARPAGRPSACSRSTAGSRGAFGEADTDFLRTYANLLGATRSSACRSLARAASGWWRTRSGCCGELQHRVKNNLQMVTSLVRLQERRARGTEARRELLAVAPPDRDAEPGLREALRHRRGRARGPGHLSRANSAPACCGCTPTRRLGCACAPTSSSLVVPAGQARCRSG